MQEYSKFTLLQKSQQKPLKVQGVHELFHYLPCTFKVSEVLHDGMGLILYLHFKHNTSLFMNAENLF